MKGSYVKGGRGFAFHPSTSAIASALSKGHLRKVRGVTFRLFGPNSEDLPLVSRNIQRIKGRNLSFCSLPKAPRPILRSSLRNRGVSFCLLSPYIMQIALSVGHIFEALGSDFMSLVLTYSHCLFEVSSSWNSGLPDLVLFVLLKAPYATHWLSLQSSRGLEFFFANSVVWPNWVVHSSCSCHFCQ